MKQSLEKQRVKAAEASGGISNEDIYEMASRLIAATGLSGELLEFGAGTGSLITTLHAQGYAGPITGADILPRPAGIPNDVRWLKADLNDRLAYPDESFNVIVSTEVIEHLENPRSIFREFFRLLRPSGTLLITTPNQESIRSLLALVVYGHFVAFRDESYPAHITALLRKDFERICLEVGFSSPQFYYSDSGGVPKLPQLRWQKFGRGLFKGRLFSDNIAVITRKLHPPR